VPRCDEAVGPQRRLMSTNLFVDSGNRDRNRTGARVEDALDRHGGTLVERLNPETSER